MEVKNYFLQAWIRKVSPLFLMLLFVNLGWGQSQTYTFTSKSWAANPTDWTSVKDGLSLQSNQGIQINTGATGACGNSPESFSNISKVIVNYSTNSSKGVGTINVFAVSGTSSQAQSGTRIGTSQSVTTTGGTTTREMIFTPATPVTGNLQIYVACTTNSIYIHSVQITYSSSPTTPTVQTTVANGITSNDAILNGSINANGFEVTTSFEYGTSSTLPSNPNLTIDGDPLNLNTSVANNIEALLENLFPNTQYYYRAVATKTEDVSSYYGATLSFWTLANAPLTPTVNNPSVTSLNVSLNATDGNPASTEYAILSNEGKYVQLDGTLGTSPVWLVNGVSGWNTSITVSGLTANTSYGFQVKARNGAAVETALSSPLTLSTLPNTAPTIELNTLTDFAGTCIDTSADTQILEIIGENLNTDVVVVGPLNGFSFSNDAGVTYANQVSLTADINGNLIEEVLVKFTPTVVQSYNGNITVSGGGASAVNVSVVASGINTPVSVTTGVSDVITTNSVTLLGSLIQGCTTVTAYGFEYSTTNNFSNGTIITATNLSAANYTASLPGLQSNTTYYYKAFATDVTGTVYGAQNTFTTLPLTAPLAIAATAIGQTGFTANWEAVAGASGYVLDVYELERFTLYNENFNSFVGAGFNSSVEAGKINSNIWKITGLSDGDTVYNDNKSSGDYAKGESTGGVTSGGVYSFEIATGNKTFGFQPTGSDFAPGAVTLRVKNTSGQTLNALSISYKIYVNNNENRSSSFNFLHSSNDLAFTAVSELNYTSPKISDTNGWTLIEKQISLTGLSLADQADYYLKWSSNDVDGSGSRDEFGLDDIVVSSSALEYAIEIQNVGNVTSYEVTGLDPNKQYYYVVRATDGGVSANSNEIAVTTLFGTTTWDGIAWSNNAPNADFNAIIDGDYTIPTNITAKDLTINSGKTLRVKSGNTLTVSGNLTNNGSIIFESDATGTASFAAYNGVAIEGPVTVERFIPAKRAWRMLTAPLKGNASNTIAANWQGTNGEGLLLFSPATYQSQAMTGYTTGGVAPNIWKYNAGWQSIANVGSENIYDATHTKPFLVFATGAFGSPNVATGATATTLRPTGALITGPVTHTALATGVFHALANPYASAINPSSLIANNPGQKLWLLDPSLGTVGVYTAYDGTNWVPTTPTENDLNIQSGQGFFVRSATASNFVINEADKVSGSSNTWFERNTVTSEADKDKIRVLLYKQNATQWQLADGILAVNYAAGTNGVDAMDTPKISNFNESIMFSNEATNLAIAHNALPIDGTVQAIRMTGTSVMAYELRVRAENYTNSTLIPVLEDTATGSFTAIPLDGTELVVPFTGAVSNATAPDNRFRIVYQSTLGTGTVNGLVVNVFPNPVVNKQLNVHLGANTTTAAYTITNLLGQTIQKGELANTQNIITIDTEAQGVYILNVNQEGMSYTTKIYVQ